MKKKTLIFNLIKILLCICILFLSARAFYSLIVKMELSSYISALFSIDGINSMLILVIGIIILLILLGITFLFTSDKSIDSFLHWLLLFFAFIPLPDMIQLLQLCNSNPTGEGHILPAIDFDIINNLYLLADFPKDMILLFILLFALTRIDKFYFKKKEIALAAFALLCYAAMLFLPGLSTILLFIGSYLFIFMTHGLLEPFVKKCEKRYEKYICFALLTVLIGKCIYRALLIINAYPI